MVSVCVAVYLLVVINQNELHNSLVFFVCLACLESGFTESSDSYTMALPSAAASFSLVNDVFSCDFARKVELLCVKDPKSHTNGHCHGSLYHTFHHSRLLAAEKIRRKIGVADAPIKFMANIIQPFYDRH